jgi:hypothetical protein
MFLVTRPSGPFYLFLMFVDIAHDWKNNKPPGWVIGKYARLREALVFVSAVQSFTS